MKCRITTVVIESEVYHVPQTLAHNAWIGVTRSNRLVCSTEEQLRTCALRFGWQAEKVLENYKEFLENCKKLRKDTMVES